MPIIIPMTRTHPSASHALAVLATAAAGLFIGCAGSSKAPARQPEGGAPVQVQDASDLAALAKGVKTKEDSLVLDLLIGYRMLLVNAADPKALDSDALKRSRKAFERLEDDMRHGGMKSRDGGERVYSITNEDRLSLQEVLRSASASAGKAARAGDWEKAKARWREIIQSKPAVAWAMEEATWGLTLADALAGPLPDPIKKKLKDVDESYAREISQDEIAQQVKALLAETIQDDKLRRELKKLANRAWERDKRAGRLTAAGASPAPDTGRTALAGAGLASPGAAPADALPPPAASPEAAAAQSKVDTLISQGRYLPALRSLDAVAGADPAWVKDRKAVIGDRYCEEKRKNAATGFKEFKKAGSDGERGLHLRRTAAELDSCLFYFPDLPVTQKVRSNREMVEREIKKLKP